MENTACLTIKTISQLEFESVELLAEDIMEKLSEIEADMYSNERSIDILVSTDLQQKKRIRRKLEKGVERDRGYTSKEMVLSLPQGTLFKVVVPYLSNIRKTNDMISSFVIGLSSGRIRIGDNTTLGCGVCICCGIENSEGISIVSELPGITDYIDTYNGQCDFVIVKAHTDAGILIRDNLHKNQEYITNEAGIPIIPATTWKGIFRNSIEQWISYTQDDKNKVDLLFGNKSRGIKGKLVFYDSVISDYYVYTEKRMHLNKFSGNAYINGIKSNSYVVGYFEIRIECLVKLDIYKALIATVLRDFHSKRINVGADMGIGKGFIEIDDIQWNTV